MLAAGAMPAAAAGIAFQPPDWPGYVALGSLVMLVVGLLIGAVSETQATDDEPTTQEPRARTPMASRADTERRQTVQRGRTRRRVNHERRVR